MTLPTTPGEYQRHIAERLNWFERLADAATSQDERLDVANRLLMEILKYISVGEKSVPPPFPQLPRVIEFDLTAERSSPGEPFAVTGDTITAITDGTLGGIGVRIDRPGSDLVRFSECNPYPYLPGFTNLYLQNTAQEGKTLKLYIGTAGAVANVELTSVTFAINIEAAEIMMPIDVQSSYIMLPVDIQAQYVTLDIDIVAQTVGAIDVDITAMTIGPIDIDIAAQSIGNIAIDIAAQTIGNLNVNIAASAVTMNVAVTGTANISITAQDVGIFLTPDWYAKEGQGIYLRGTSVDLDSRQFDVPIVNAIVPTGKIWYIYQWSGYAFPNAGWALHGIAGYLKVGSNIITDTGGVAGFATTLPVPIKATAGVNVCTLGLNFCDVTAIVYMAVSAYEVDA